MKKENYKKIAKNVIDLEIQALKKLKSSINNSFNKAVDAIVKCQGKIILCGAGKSGLIGFKVASTLSSVGSPSFALSANDCLHGDLGSISKKDILILISNSGETKEIRPVIQHANRNKITLIGITSKKNSVLYKASDIKLFIPEVKESEEIVPTSSTSAQLSLGDSLAIASMKKKKFGKLDFKKFHPSGNLGAKLKSAADLMVTGKKIPFANENLKMKFALKIISNKKLGVLLIRNKRGLTNGICTDADVKRAIEKYKDIKNLPVKKIMSRKPIGVDQDTLAAKCLHLMNEKKITCLVIHGKKNKNRTQGILHVHNILEANIQ